MGDDKSNGYEQFAERFMSGRNPHIGMSTVRDWCRPLPPRASILELGCGHGILSEMLMEEGFTLHGLDASAKMIAAYRNRLPNVLAECSAVEDSEFFGRAFEGIVAWGLIFLLTAAVQPVAIQKAARALNSGGKLLFTAPEQTGSWADALTGRESVSLGFEQYRRMIESAGLKLDGVTTDEGDNHYYLCSKP